MRFECRKIKISIISIRSLDPKNSGEISLEKFRKIMKNKEGFTDEDVDEMIEGEIVYREQPCVYNQVSRIQTIYKSGRNANFKPTMFCSNIHR